MARIPKLAVNVMAAEVNRLLQLTKNSIIPISYIVPRRVGIYYFCRMCKKRSALTAFALMVCLIGNSEPTKFLKR